ncbi:glycine zipper domain-containing protein [Desulfolithobacter sp.]
MKYISIFVVLGAFLLASCAEQNKAQIGAGGGAVAGALVGQAIGHNTQATLIGAAVGTMLGYIIGNEMDKYDREQLNHVYERGVSNQPTSWVNPDTGNEYRVVPKPAYTDPETSRVCRQAEIEAVIDGKVEKTYTVACRDENGRWQLQR